MNWKVLILSDDPGSTDLIQRQLDSQFFRGSGFDVTSTDNNQQAKWLLQRNSYSLILIIDTMMGKQVSLVNLIEFVRHQQNDDFIKIVVVSGYEQAIVLEMLEQHDINGYIEQGTYDFLGITRMVLTMALRDYENDLRRESKINEFSKLQHLYKELASATSVYKLIKIMFYKICNERLVQSAGLFYRKKLIDTYRVDDKSRLVSIFREWEKNGRPDNLYENNYFTGIREFENYVFCIQVGRHGKEYVDSILTQGIMIRRMLMKPIRNRRILKMLLFIMHENMLYIQTHGRNTIARQLVEEKELELPFKDIFLYFSSENLLKISRSIAVNPRAISKVIIRSYRQIELELIGNHILKVSSRMTKQVLEYIENRSWLKKLMVKN